MLTWKGDGHGDLYISGVATLFVKPDQITRENQHPWEIGRRKKRRGTEKEGWGRVFENWLGSFFLCPLIISEVVSVLLLSHFLPCPPQKLGYLMEKEEEENRKILGVWLGEFSTFGFVRYEFRGVWLSMAGHWRTGIGVFLFNLTMGRFWGLSRGV